jgi:hypothetical protein
VFYLHNLQFGYTGRLKTPIITISQIEQFSFNLTNIIRTPSNSESKNKISNSDNVCVVTTETPAISIIDSIGLIYRSTFTNINTGAIALSGGILYLVRVSFSNNIIPTATLNTEFNIRHNVYSGMGGNVIATTIKTDTNNNWFIASEADSYTKPLLTRPSVQSAVAVREDNIITFTISLILNYEFIIII